MTHILLTRLILLDMTHIPIILLIFVSLLVTLPVARPCKPEVSPAQQTLRDVAKRDTYLEVDSKKSRELDFSRICRSDGEEDDDELPELEPVPQP